MQYTIKDIAEVIQAEAILPAPERTVEHLLVDSRRLVFPDDTLFFALQGSRRSGESFVDELYAAGVRSFVVSSAFDVTRYEGANFIRTDNTLRALQVLVAGHRKKFDIPVIGITGSNGKTIVKEWLYQLLQPDYNIVRSPKSYNSQIGVPLSVWQLNEQHDLAIFEAGISEKKEMDFLESIIQPNIGLLTNIGAAHSAAFESKQQKLEEKWKLFKGCHSIICSNLNPVISVFVERQKQDGMFVWGTGAADLKITNIEKLERESIITATYGYSILSITIPFTDNASIENAISCWCVMLLFKIDNSVIQQRMKLLQPVEMRLQLKKAVNNCSVINDSYSNDLSSLKIALDFLQQQSGNLRPTVILSDLGEVASTASQYDRVLEALEQHKVRKFIGIGPRLNSLQTFFAESLQDTSFYPTVDDFIKQFSVNRFRDEVILIKGARSFQFERINLLFEQKVHQTVLEVNLTAMGHNLKEYQRYVNPSTKVMVMVKAFSYGSGSAEVARILQFHKVDYLAVAYADEGVELRQAGIHLPIMVMNPEIITFQSLIDYNLEPEIYSFGIIEEFSNYLLKEGIQQFPVHIKIDTGMHRLGFELSEVDKLASLLKSSGNLVIRSVFSHMVASESSEHDEFSKFQAEQFQKACATIEEAAGHSFLKHIANSAAIFRHPAYQFDMVRLGIGVYGVDSIGESKLNLLPVVTLKTTIAQLRKVSKGETVGYSRRGKVERDSIIATIRIGYADGFNRKLGNGVGRVWLHNTEAPVIGNVCMDMTMIDVTGIEGVAEGDFVEIFGPHMPVQQVAKWSQTIPYEVMTGVSQRVKRVYYEE